VEIVLLPDDLWNLGLLLHLVCSRNKATLANRARQWACYYAKRIDLESNLHGFPVPKPPYHTGGIRNTPPGAI
jgi:hypothetical protein